ncbi:MAG: glycosyltransferase family 2 protein, partial [Paracoccaceae bacterium]|nr:glycosyltransferase family 2 protein [Paracoccaceae bacterium]
MSNSDPIVSIIVVSYNTREMTLECLRSVFAQTDQPFELIVIDNASSDGSAAAIAQEFPDILLLAEKDNHGFARANNLAAATATGKYLLLLNPDTIVLDGAIDRLISFAGRSPKSRIWGGKTVFADGSINPSSCWRRMTLWGLFCSATGLSRVFPNSPRLNPEAYGGWNRDSERDVDIVTGCFFLIEKKDWDLLGGFDEIFFMYGEEADLCLRARSIGAKPRVTPEAVIVHYGGASEKVRVEKMVRLLTAKMELIKRHFPTWRRPLAAMLFSGWPLSRMLAANVLR